MQLSPSPVATAPRVLIVEDEARLRDLLMDVIPDMGFSATSARSAEEARRVMETEPHAILLLDLRLPGMSGMDFFESVRDAWPRTQVIILSGYGDLPAAKRAIHLDVVEFLGKPCHLKEVELALDRARRRLSTPPAAAGSSPAVSQGFPLETDREAETISFPTLKQSEQALIVTALARNRGNRSAAARELGISRRTLHYRLRMFQQEGIEIE